jgi:hypothetical protein
MVGKVACTHYMYNFNFKTKRPPLSALSKLGDRLHTTREQLGQQIRVLLLLRFCVVLPFPAPPSAAQ